MKRYLLHRLGEMLPMLFLVSVAAFAMVRLMPGDPATAYLNSINAAATPEALAKIRAEFGLDKSIAVQYFVWLKKAAALDLGISYMTKKAVAGQLFLGLRYTLLLTAGASVWIIGLSLPLGIAAGTAPGKPGDMLIRAFTFLGSSMPPFWLGFLLVEVFALRFGLLPVQGAGTLRHLLLPSFTLACSYIAMYTKMLRNGIAARSHAEYAISAYARGLSKRAVLLRHVLPNAINPVVTTLSLSLGSLLSGTVIIENVFSWPGLGRMIVNAVSGRDYPMIQGYILMTAAVYTVLNLGADLACAFLDPGLYLRGKDGQ